MISLLHLQKKPSQKKEGEANVLGGKLAVHQICKVTGAAHSRLPEELRCKRVCLQNCKKINCVVFSCLYKKTAGCAASHRLLFAVGKTSCTYTKLAVSYSSLTTVFHK